jgi:hypothetical protein
MHYALRRARQPSAAAHGSAAPSSGSPESLSKQLQARRSDYSTAWLAEQLRCPEATAAALAECWLPAGPPHMRLQQLNAQAAWFGVDARRLGQLLDEPAAPPTVEVRTVRSAARYPPAPANPAAPAPKRELHLGSAEGVRVVQQRQPTIVYRKPRRAVTPV